MISADEPGIGIREFEAGDIEAGTFQHEDHVRIAWLYLREHSLLESIDRYCAAQPGYRTSMTRSRLVFDRLRHFPRWAIDTVIPLARKKSQPIKSLTDLTRQLVQYPN